MKVEQIEEFLYVECLLYVLCTGVWSTTSVYLHVFYIESCGLFRECITATIMYYVMYLLMC